MVNGRACLHASILKGKNVDDGKKAKGKEDDSPILLRMLFLHAVKGPGRPLLLLA